MSKDRAAVDSRELPLVAPPVLISFAYSTDGSRAQDAQRWHWEAKPFSSQLKCMGDTSQELTFENSYKHWLSHGRDTVWAPGASDTVPSSGS